MSIATVNTTGSRWEKLVDGFMDSVNTKVGAFEHYVKSPEGKYRIEMVEMVASFAAASILGLRSPLVVGVSALAGTVVRAFSPEQLKNIGDASERISDAIPTSVKALAVVITVTYTPILMPVAAGLYLGFQIGSRLNPKKVANAIDTAASKLPLNGQLVTDDDVEQSDNAANQYFTQFDDKDSQDGQDNSSSC